MIDRKKLLKRIERFIEQELQVRRDSFLPVDNDDDQAYLAKAERALDAARTLVNDEARIAELEKRGAVKPSLSRVAG